jgi:chain length determinant protein (polysaccharide antigen chain regulator)
LIAAREHDDRVAHLKEALIIAKQLNIKKPTGSAFVSNDQGQNTKAKPTGVVLDSQDVPLYFRGYKALQGELEQLQQRKNDDSFILGLRELQGELTALGKVHVDLKLIHSVRLDQKARVDKTPIKPKRNLIMVLGGMLGLMFGIFGAFIKSISQH